MTKIDPPLIYEIECNEKAVKKFKEDLNHESNYKRKIILNYPTVYLYNYKKSKYYEVYVGETSDIIRRITQHFYKSRRGKNDWQEVLKKQSVKMIIMGHNHFNKSLTLDIEHRLMLYLSAVENVERIYNRRGNSQNEYYTSDELNLVFSKIWKQLGTHNPELFPLESIITDSALFKASPFHKLTEEQYEAKREILSKVQIALKSNIKGQVIFVSGEAGTGKTVLNSSLFYELSTYQEHSDIGKINSYLLVNHEQQLTVYKQIAEKLDLYKGNKEIVSKPTQFINKQSAHNPVDVVLIDEAHLLWTQGKQSYRGNNQLKDIMERAKVVIVMFDKKQILRTEQYWEAQMIEQLESQAKSNNSYIELKSQLRINAGSDTIKWIRNFIDEQKINNIPYDKNGYEITIFDTPKQLHKEIKAKSKNTEAGLSRLIATFDWEYIDKTPPRFKKYWEVVIDNWKLPWNLQIQPKKEDRKKNKKLAWAEQKHTIEEVGSTFTIQGFDLNYAGVILGPSVKYRNGKVVFDPSCSKNKKAIQNRTLSDGSKQNFADMLLRNEINVLLTRGVNGLYIYAQDKELREALQNAKY